MISLESSRCALQRAPSLECSLIHCVSLMRRIILIICLRHLPECYADPGCILLPPRLRARPSKHIKNIAAAIATRFKAKITTVNQRLRDAEIEEWGKVRMVDHQDGDTMRASSMSAQRDDSRNASFVRVRVTALVKSTYS